MTDKELNQIEEMLSGRGRYKLLDCSRRNLFDLPAGAFKLWHVIYSMESSNQEAYPSLNTLVRVSRMTLNTVIKWKKYLLETGWLIKLEGSAGDRYSEPTNGAWNVPVIRVDDPTKGKSNEKGTAKNDVGVLQKMKPPIIADKVTVAFVPAFAVASGIEVESMNAVCKFDSSIISSREVPEEQKQKEQKQKPVRLSSVEKWKLKYSEDKPVWFDTASQVTRSEWCEAHRLDKVKVSPAVMPPVGVPPP